MIQKLILTLCLIVPLTACDKIGNFLIDKIEEVVPDETTAQKIKAAKVYSALENKDLTKFISLVEQNVQEILLKDKDTFETMYQMIPDAEQHAEVEVIKHTAAINPTEGKTTVIVYKYTYPQKDVYMSVVFSGHDGGDLVRGVWIENGPNKLEDDSLITEINTGDSAEAQAIDEASATVPSGYS